MPALLAMQALGQGSSAAEAFQRGDYSAGFLDLGNGILAGVGAGEAAQAGEAGSVAASEAEAPAAAETAAEALPAARRGRRRPGWGRRRVRRSIRSRRACQRRLSRRWRGRGSGKAYPTEQCVDGESCFTAEMLVGCEGGRRRADEVRKGDRFWSRNELDPDGPVELKEVEAVFVRVAPIKNVHAAGQVLRTTAEHPFHVAGRGWVPACA